MTGLLTLLLLVNVVALGQTTDYGFMRDNTIPVYDSAGLFLPKAWNGGMNACHFNEMDIDFDGNNDLVVFDKTGDRISCYRNEGWPDSVAYTLMPEWEHFFPAITGWIQLKDYNCDGREDLFGYTPAGIQVWQNTSDTILKFKLITPLLNSWQGSGYSNIGLTYVDYPGISDIDGDGDLDILVFFGLGAYVQMHRNMSMEVTGTCDSLLFERTFNCWGDFAESASNNELYLDITCPWKKWEQLNENTAKSDAKHTGSTMLLLDINNDNRQDLVLGDVDFLNLILLENGGTQDSAHMIAFDTLFPSGSTPVQLVSFPVASMVDLNNDLRDDLLVSPFDPNPLIPQSHNSIWYYENQGTITVPQFTFQKPSFFQDEMIEVGSGAYPVLFDADADGLEDLIVANYGYLDSNYYEFGYLKSVFNSKLAIFKNTGTAGAPAFSLQSRDYAQTGQLGYRALFPAFADMDNDGDRDMICGEAMGTLLYFQNTASAGAPAVFAAPVATWQGIDVGDYAAPAVEDIDGDGLLDLIIGKKNGMLSWYRNTGTLTAPVFVLENDSLGGVNVCDYQYSYSGYATPAFFRGNDALLRLAVGSENGKIYYYKGIEASLNGDFIAIDTVLMEKGQDSTVRAINDGIRSAVCVKDWDNDGRPELILGNFRGGLAFFRGRGPLPFNGVEETADGIMDDRFTVFPNPAREFVNIVGRDADAAEDLLISLYDISGRCVKSEILPARPVCRMRVDDLKPGMYFYQLQQGVNRQSGKVILLKP